MNEKTNINICNNRYNNTGTITLKFWIRVTEVKKALDADLNPVGKLNLSCESGSFRIMESAI